MKRPRQIQFTPAVQRQNFMKSIQNNGEDIIIALHHKKDKLRLVSYFQTHSCLQMISAPHMSWTIRIGNHSDSLSMSGPSLVYTRGITGGWTGWAIAHPVMGRIKGAAMQWLRVALPLAQSTLGSQLSPCQDH